MSSILACLNYNKLTLLVSSLPTDALMEAPAVGFVSLRTTGTAVEVARMFPDAAFRQNCIHTYQGCSPIMFLCINFGWGELILILIIDCLLPFDNTKII